MLVREQSSVLDLVDPEPGPGPESESEPEEHRAQAALHYNTPERTLCRVCA